MPTFFDFPANFSTSTSRLSIQLVYTQNAFFLVFLGLFFIFLFFFFLSKFYLTLMEGHKRKRIDWNGASTSREPGPAQSGSPEEDDPEERVRLQKAIRKRIVALIKKFCFTYCKNMGFCGKYCSRGRADFDFLGAAHEIGKEEFFYDKSSVRVNVLRKLFFFLNNYYTNKAWKNNDMNAHWLYDVMRRTPPSS